MTMKVNLHNRQNGKNKFSSGFARAPSDRRRPPPPGATDDIHGNARHAIRSAFSGIVGE
ncbi:conserved hypothetical protein [Burkholderia pseudomallei MSHR346]|nr:conserved hypothetical protein [Burkholderia pseudomallei MSHR346]